MFRNFPQARRSAAHERVPASSQLHSDRRDISSALPRALSPRKALKIEECYYFSRCDLFRISIPKMWLVLKVLPKRDLYAILILLK